MLSAEREARSRRERWLALLPWMVVLVLLALVGRDLANVWQITNHHDLDVFTLAAERLAAGEDIYADVLPFQDKVLAGLDMDDDSVVWPYMYPPLIALLFVPTRGMPVEAVRAGWWAVNVACLLSGTWLWLRALGGVTPLRAGLALLLLWRFYPATVTLRLGQIELMQYLLLAATLYALSARRDGWAGVALGLATGLKFFPGALIVLLLWQRRWRAAGWALGTALVTIIGSFALVGLEAIPAYLRSTAIYGLGGAFAAFPLNQSLNGLFSRNLVRNGFSATLKGVHLPGLARALTLACDALIVVASAWLTWSGARRDTACRAPAGNASTDGTRSALEYGLAVAALLLISPHSQVYTFVWALLPLIVLGVHLLERDANWALWLAYIAAFVLIGRRLMVYAPGVTRFFQSQQTFGAALLWLLLGLALYLGWRRSAAGRGVSE